MRSNSQNISSWDYQHKQKRAIGKGLEDSQEKFPSLLKFQRWKIGEKKEQIKILELENTLDKTNNRLDITE